MENESLFDEESFYYEVYQALDPVIKTFLSSYFGERLLHLEPEAYSNIEAAIKNNIHYTADSIPDILYNHCTIKDSEEWDKALENFKKDNLPIPWHDAEQWFDGKFCFDNKDEDDDEETLLEDAYEFELTEDQKKAKEAIEIVDAIVNDAQNLTIFMRTGFPVLKAATRQFLIDRCIFDLKHLSHEGFIDLQNRTDMMNEMIFENIHGIIQD